uniref:Protocadherin 2 alpha a 15 n=1 Tax=Sinocyclocheilus grahami TaxID=75366 RepID=A0A672SB00_SINGR
FLLNLNAKLAFIAVAMLFGRAVWAQIRYSISEEQKDGAAVGNIAKDLGIDHRTLKERGFRIVSTSGESMFSLNQNDGVLYVNGKIDREDVCERSIQCLINLKIALENPLEIHYVIVEILDVNDHSPLFPENEKRLEIGESALPGARYPLQAARDPDSGSNSVQTYKLSHNDNFRLEIKDREEDGKIPILILHKPLDREVTKNIKLVLTALDGGRPPKSGSIEIFVDVQDINDNVPVFTKEAYTITLNENAPVGTTIVQVNATDLDEGKNGEVVYAFGNNVNYNLRRLFEVNSITGEIILTDRLDFEMKDKYEIDIQASDKGIVPHATVKSVIIKIVDVNDNAPEIEVTSFSNAIPEDSRPGTTVALISVTDLDSGETVLPGARFQLQAARDPDSGSNSVQTYKLSHTDYFRIEIIDRDEDGKAPVLVLQKPLDREITKSMKLQMTALDGGRPPKSGTMDIVIDVLDINDNAPDFTKATYTVTLNENAHVGTVALRVNATDLDEGQNGEVVYSLGHNVNYKLRKLFDVNPITGEIIVTGLLDFEIKDKYQIDIQASDKGIVPLTTDQIITIKIADINDNPPQIEVTSFSSAIPEDSKPGTTVALISVSDLDSEINGRVTCSFPEDIPFKLMPSSQENTYSLVTTSSLDRETISCYDITLEAKDAGQPPLSSVKSITVQVSDVNDNSPEFSFSPYAFYVMENNAPGKNLFSVSASDKDTGENSVVSYQIWRDGVENKYTSFININSENGEIYALKSFDFETVKTFQFQVVATDSGTPSLSSNVTVNVWTVDLWVPTYCTLHGIELEKYMLKL